jgi:hypothetical protein
LETYLGNFLKQTLRKEKPFKAFCLRSNNEEESSSKVKTSIALLSIGFKKKFGTESLK